MVEVHPVFLNWTILKMLKTFESLTSCSVFKPWPSRSRQRVVKITKNKGDDMVLAGNFYENDVYKRVECCFWSVGFLGLLGRWNCTLIMHFLHWRVESSEHKLLTKLHSVTHHWSRKMEKFLRLILVLLVSSFVFASNEIESEGSDKKGKILNFFTVVRFPNSVCAADTLNGTCYSAEECSSRGGTQSGTCAGGYGVCCTCKYKKFTN